MLSFINDAKIKLLVAENVFFSKKKFQTLMEWKHSFENY